MALPIGSFPFLEPAWQSKTMMNRFQLHSTQWALSLFTFLFRRTGLDGVGGEVSFGPALLLCFILSAVYSAGFLIELCRCTNLARFLKVFHSLFVGDAAEADAIYFQQTITWGKRKQTNKWKRVKLLWCSSSMGANLEVAHAAIDPHAYMCQIMLLCMKAIPLVVQRSISST